MFCIHWSIFKNKQLVQITYGKKHAELNYTCLGKDCNGLKVDGKGPEDLHSGELVVQHQSQQRHRGNQELDPENSDSNFLDQFQEQSVNP